MSVIKEGDLVLVVRAIACCGNPFRLGQIHRVVSDDDRLPFATCKHCGHTRPHLLADTVKLSCGSYFERVRLKRIPPMGELEGLDWAHKLDVRQPA